MRERPVLHAGEEHDRELQALGRVQRHERHPAGIDDLRRGSGAVRRRVRDLVAVGDEGRPFEELPEAAVRVAGVELAGDGHQLRQVVQPAFVLRVGAGTQLSDEAGAVQRRLEDGLDAGARFDERAKLLHHRDEPADSVV